MQIASLSGRVATYVNYALWCCSKNGFYHIGVHTGTWWVGNDYIRTSVLGNEFFCQNILHIACIEQGVANLVYFRVDLGILDSFGYILDTNHLACLLGYKVGNGSCTCVKVVNQFVASKSGKVAGYRVQVVGLLGVGLVETLGTNLKLQVLHQLVDVVDTLEYQYLLVADGIVALLIVEIHQRGNLWEFVGDVLQQSLGLFLALGQCLGRCAVVVELEDNHPLATGAVADDDIAQQSYLGTQVEER